MASPTDRADGQAGGDDLPALAAAYAPGLRRYFLRRAEAHEVDDLVQEVFLRLQARSAAEPVGNIEGYLFRIAKHVLLNRRRARRADSLWAHEPLDDEHLADEASPERALAAKQELSRVIVAILSLPPRTRVAFEFHRFEKLSYSAIAQRMGVSKGTVQVLMQRAIDRLAQEMRKKP